MISIHLTVSVKLLNLRSSHVVGDCVVLLAVIRRLRRNLMRILDRFLRNPLGL